MPIPQILPFACEQANFIGSSMNTQDFSKKDDLTYTPDALTLNAQTKNLDIATQLGCLPKVPQSMFYHKIATAAGVNQAAVGGFTAYRYRVKQGVAPTHSGSGDDLLNIGPINIVCPVCFANNANRVTAPAGNIVPAYVIRKMLPAT